MGSSQFFNFTSGTLKFLHPSCPLSRLSGAIQGTRAVPNLKASEEKPVTFERLCRCVLVARLNNGFDNNSFGRCRYCEFYAILTTRKCIFTPHELL